MIRIPLLNLTVTGLCLFPGLLVAQPNNTEENTMIVDTPIIVAHQTEPVTPFFYNTSIAVFNREIDITFSKFNVLDFSNCRFKRHVFLQTNIIKTLYAHKTKFMDLFCNNTIDDMYVYEPIIENEIDFTNCRFKNKLHLQNLQLNENNRIWFKATTLPDTLILAYSKQIVNDLDFSRCHFAPGKKVNLALFNFDISKINLDYKFFKLLFIQPAPYGYDFPYRGGYGSTSYDEQKSIYEQLLNNFKTRGKMESYKLLDLEYQEFLGKTSSIAFIWWLPKIWWNYGYNKERVFLWCLVFISFFWLINIFILNYLTKNVYVVGNIPVVAKGFGLSRLWYSFIYTVMIFFALTLKIDKINFKKVISLLYILMIYAIGLICLAYIANFIIQK